MCFLNGRTHRCRALGHIVSILVGAQSVVSVDMKSEVIRVDEVAGLLCWPVLSRHRGAFVVGDPCLLQEHVE